MNPILVVWLKELLDTLRDRRTLWSMVIGPVLVMPLLIILPQWIAHRQVQVQGSSALLVAVNPTTHAPGLLRFLEGQNVKLFFTEEPEAAIRDRKASVGLIIGERFEADLAAMRPASLTVLVDRSKWTSSGPAARLNAILEAYSRQLVTKRVVARGLSPAVLTPINLQNRNLATPGDMGGAYLGLMLPFFIVLFALMGGMYTAIDVTAGEKERLTLEPLLGTPASRSRIVIGKLLAVISTSMGALFLAVASMLAAFAAVEPMYASNGMPMAFSLSPLTAVRLFLAALPVVLMFGALEMAVCLFARSFKEAQSYIFPLQFIVLIPAMVVILAPDLSPSLLAHAIPVFGPMVVLRNLLLGTGEPYGFAVMLASSSAYAGLSLLLATRLFRKERVLFRT